MKIVYTYWTNNGDNYLAGFGDIESFKRIALESLEASALISDNIVIYTDVEGRDKLLELGISTPTEVVDYSAYEFNPNWWNFPKLITYSLQNTRFLHLDFDVVLHTIPTNLDATLICEKYRGLTQLSYQREFLPKVIQDNFSPKLICSGILGGDPEIFKVLMTVAEPIVLTKGFITFETLFTLEEVALTALAKINNITAEPIDCDFTHYQGSKQKKELMPEMTLEELKISTNE